MAGTFNEADLSHHLMGNNGENEFAVLGSHVAKVE